jgi:hypothetical protein
MTLTPDNIAKLIFHLSNLRWLEKEHLSDTIKDPETEKAITILKMEIDKELSEAGLDEHFDLSTLTEIVKLYAETYSKKESKRLEDAA